MALAADLQVPSLRRREQTDGCRYVKSRRVPFITRGSKKRRKFTTKTLRYLLRAMCDRKHTGKAFLKCRDETSTATTAGTTAGIVARIIPGITAIVVSGVGCRGCCHLKHGHGAVVVAYRV